MEDGSATRKPVDYGVRIRIFVTSGFRKSMDVRFSFIPRALYAANYPAKPCRIRFDLLCAFHFNPLDAVVVGLS